MTQAAAQAHGSRAGPMRPGGLYPMALMGILATVAMLFAAFTAALFVRRIGTDWDPIALPSVVYLGLAALILSSVSLERARRRVRHDDQRGTVRQLGAAAALGGLFLVGQVASWASLAGQGVFLSTNPHASFFYMLSAVHGAHVLGGLAALAWTRRRAIAGGYTAKEHTGIDHTAIYWHFVGVVWVYLLVLLITL